MAPSSFAARLRRSASTEVLEQESPLEISYRSCGHEHYMTQTTAYFWFFHLHLAYIQVSTPAATRTSSGTTPARRTSAPAFESAGTTSAANSSAKTTRSTTTFSRRTTTLASKSWCALRVCVARARPECPGCFRNWVLTASASMFLAQAHLPHFSAICRFLPPTRIAEACLTSRFICIRVHPLLFAFSRPLFRCQAKLCVCSTAVAKHILILSMSSDP